MLQFVDIVKFVNNIFLAEKGFSITRECGLAPCQFSDDAINKQLGLGCDQGRAEYSCITCCKENGCNKSSASVLKSGYTFRMLLLVMLVLLTISRKFQPPYVSDSVKF